MSAFGLLIGIGTEKIGRYTYGKTPAVMAQLEIEYDDGSRQIDRHGRSWKVTGDGPIREADLLMGEFYDARQEMPGWSQAGFDDSGWEAAILAEENGQPDGDVLRGRQSDAAGPDAEDRRHARSISDSSGPSWKPFPACRCE